ncbi:MAG: peptidylprolyl isomerase [Luteolibacter sp.]
MRTFTKFSLRFAIYLLVVAYLVADLFIFNGPLAKRIGSRDPNTPHAIAEAKARGVVARVFNHEINRKQLDYAIHERMWLEGKTFSDLTSTDRQLVTYAALGDLIDHEILRVKTKVNTHELIVSDNEIDDRLKRFASKFETKDALKSAMKSQGIPNEKSLRKRMAARIQQEKYVALRVDPLVIVTEDELQTFYEKNKANLEIPERIQAKHIFIATLDTPSEKAEEKLKTALAELKASKKDFQTLANELSEDPSSKNKGGDLGWMSKQRIIGDFSEQVFALKNAEPTLIRTRLGWHIVSVTGREPTRPQSFEEARPEILSALTALKRHEAVIRFRTTLRKYEAAKIVIFHDQLAL